MCIYVNLVEYFLLDLTGMLLNKYLNIRWQMTANAYNNNPSPTPLSTLSPNYLRPISLAELISAFHVILICQ